MKVAIALTGNRVSGPGEAMEIVIYDLGETAEVIESYENPALRAQTGRGISMIKSVIDRGINDLVVSGIGDHAMQYADGKVHLLNGGGLSLDVVLQRLVSGGLPAITEASHHGHHQHRMN